MAIGNFKKNQSVMKKNQSVMKKKQSVMKLTKVSKKINHGVKEINQGVKKKSPWLQQNNQSDSYLEKIHFLIIKMLYYINSVQFK